VAVLSRPLYRLFPFTMTNPQQKETRVSDLKASLWITVGLAAYFFLWHVPTPHRLLSFAGWEYAYLAQALLSGRGFADPFGVASGPSAWMPPLLVVWIATVFAIFGIKTQFSLYVLGFSNIFLLGLSVFILFRIFAYSAFSKQRWLPVVGLLWLVLAWPTYFFALYHDVLLNLLLLTGLVYLHLRIEPAAAAISSATESSQRRLRRWILVLYFLLPLANPVMIAPAVLLALLRIFAPRLMALTALGTYARQSLIFALLSLITSSLIWTGRNYITLGTPHFIKSNFWYELYQTSVLDADGLLSEEFFMRTHPALRPQNAQQFAERGEALVLQHAKAATLAKLNAQPEDFWLRVQRRALNAFWYLDLSTDVAQIQGHFSRAELAQLLRSPLAVRSNVDARPIWCSLLLPADSVRREMQRLKPLRGPYAFRIWKRQSLQLRRSLALNSKPRGGYLLAAVPTLLSLSVLVLALGGKKLWPALPIAAVVHLSFLLPYALVSHYERYQFPLLALFALLISYSLLSLCALLSRFVLASTSHNSTGHKETAA
jgi:hypothetical protein